MPVSRSRATISIRPYEVHFDCSQTAAVGIALAIAFIRGIARREMETHRNLLGGHDALSALYAIEPSLKFSARDEAFLEDLERRSFQYFWDQGNTRLPYSYPTLGGATLAGHSGRK